MYDKAKLAKILAACEKATPGPWEWEPHQEGMDHFTGPWYEPASIRIGDNYFVAFSLDADAQFIALARTALPALARQCEALMEVVKTAEEVFKQIDLRTRTLGLDMSNYHAISIQIKPCEADKDYWQAVWAYNKAMAALEALAEGSGE